ncbi:MAG: 50S ribosomal protein L11 [Planctomycetota bacterium]|nr:MAG: 50S ribosomal protein L11 [Planctomycetota bacterium]
MAKQLVNKIKLQIPGGQATPAPPVGPALGQAGVNIGQFVSKFNEMTKDKQGMIIPVVISVFSDKSFELELKSPPAAVLIKKEANIAKGASQPGKEAVGAITREQLEKIAKIKMPDLNTNNIEAAMKIIAGTARSMGVIIKDS